jgi:hypothetical protein
MGLSIYYKGNLEKASDLPSMITELIDISKIEGWKYHVYEEKFENDVFSEIIDTDNLYGISISAPKSEPVCFSFLSNGKMCGIINFNVMKIDNKIDELLTYSVSSKTQYAGYIAHKKIILVLDYISKKYLNNFECQDEGFYWETRDEDLLKKTFEKYTNLIEGFISTLEMIPKNEGEKLEEYLIRMFEITNKNSKK